MKNKALVAYASKYGSTQEVAAAVAAELRAGGLSVDLKPVQKVQSLVEYDVLILGAPLYLGQWHKDAQRFLVHHREALSRPASEGLCGIAIFALGPTHDPVDEEAWQSSREMLEKELAKYPWLKLAALEVFGGKYDPAHLRFPDTLIASLPASPLHGLPASDIRDWVAIRRWANSLIPVLQQADPDQSSK